MRVQVVDPSAFTPPYDHGLCAALAHRGARVELITSRFPYGSVPTPDGYTVRELFYGGATGPPGSLRRRTGKLIEHVPDMLRYRRLAARETDVVHFQWLDVPWLDGRLLPRRPVVLTAHDLLPREPRPGQAAAQRRLFDRVDAIVVHSEYGRGLMADLGIPPDKVTVIHHGAFDHLARAAPDAPLPREVADVPGPVVLFFGLLRPYKGIEGLLEAWRGLEGAELWIVGRPRMPLGPLEATAPAGVRFISRFVSDAELGALFRRADVVVLPYARTERLDMSGVLATALAFGRSSVLTDVGGFSEVAATGAARLVPPGDVAALREAIRALLDDPVERERRAAAALAAARGPYSWERAADATLALYERISRR
jgi:glycosyltransferase involved in cell wall biosynthesis